MSEEKRDASAVVAARRRERRSFPRVRRDGVSPVAGSIPRGVGDGVAAAVGHPPGRGEPSSSASSSPSLAMERTNGGGGGVVVVGAVVFVAGANKRQAGAKRRAAGPTRGVRGLDRAGRRVARRRRAATRGGSRPSIPPHPAEPQTPGRPGDVQEETRRAADGLRRRGIQRQHHERVAAQGKHRRRRPRGRPLRRGMHLTLQLPIEVVVPAQVEPEQSNGQGRVVARHRGERQAGGGPGGVGTRPGGDTNRRGHQPTPPEPRTSLWRVLDAEEFPGEEGVRSTHVRLPVTRRVPRVERERREGRCRRVAGGAGSGGRHRVGGVGAVPAGATNVRGVALLPQLHETVGVRSRERPPPTGPGRGRRRRRRDGRQRTDGRGGGHRGILGTRHLLWRRFRRRVSRVRRLQTPRVLLAQGAGRRRPRRGEAREEGQLVRRRRLHRRRRRRRA
mmetsp:Transcript_1173/g.4778  ORF Transcript_1173/g.4778 Transcript_1173/m.4778 type:complete len:447 (+) Transcript_1173:3-1343(+)